jgi:hypothetical protein
MASRKLVDAPRRNTKKSCAPESARCKEVTGMNTAGQCLRAEHVVLPCEDREEFEAVVRALQEDWRPVGTRQCLVFDEIVDGSWQLQYIRKTRAARIKKEYWAIEPEAAAEDEINPSYADRHSKWQFEKMRKRLREFLLSNMTEADYDELDIHQDDIPGADNVTQTPANSLTVLAVAVRRSLKDLEALSRLETAITRRLRDAERELERLQANRRALVKELLE